MAFLSCMCMFFISRFCPVRPPSLFKDHDHGHNLKQTEPELHRKSWLPRRRYQHLPIHRPKRSNNLEFLMVISSHFLHQKLARLSIVVFLPMKNEGRWQHLARLHVDQYLQQSTSSNWLSGQEDIILDELDLPFTLLPWNLIARVLASVLRAGNGQTEAKGAFGENPMNRWDLMIRAFEV